MIYNSLYSGEEIDEAVGAFQNLKGMLSELIEILYPIGCIYTSTQPTNPTDLFGGTWIQIKDTFLLTAGDIYTAGSTGGNATHTHTSAAHTHTTAGHTLTIDEMPKHGHGVYIWDNAGTMGNAWYYNGDTQQTHTGARLYNSSASTWIASGSTANAAGSGKGDPSGGTAQIGDGVSHSHGDTGSTTPGVTGSSSSLPPYRVVYAWERTA